MATFPELEPNTRSYDFGLFPLTEEPSLSAGIVRFRHSTAPQNYQLTLGYTAISDAQATLIRNHYQGQGGGYRSFELPAIIWRGHTSNDNIVPAPTLWRYSETPEEEHLAVGRINVTIALVSDGVIPPTEAPGFTGGITTSITAGAATGGAAGGDPNFANVSLLLHMNGANGSTTFTDSSSNALTITRSGDAQISTAQSKFGGASGAFDGTGDYISMPYSTLFAFAAGNFTIEMWLYRTGVAASFSRIWGANGDVYHEADISISSSGELGSAGTTSGTSWNAWLNGNIATITANTWTHIALVRNGGTVTMYVNGTGTALTTTLGATALATGTGGATTRTIGSQAGTDRPYFGYIDDVRVTKGVARYTANFTPPTAPFPDYDSDAATYIAAVEAADGQSLETGVKTAINNFVAGCKADGIWTAIKASCILAGARTLTGALVPLVGTAPTNNNFVSGDYNRETGLVGNASTKYLDSNRNITSDPQNNSHIAVYASSVGGGAYIGTDNAGSGDTFILTDSTNASWPFRHRISTFNAGSQGTRGTNVAGLIAVTRSTSTTCISRVNGANATLTSTSTSIPSRNCGVFCRIGSSGALDYSSARLAFYSIGESLDLALLDTRVTALINAIAAAIP